MPTIEEVMFRPITGSLRLTRYMDVAKFLRLIQTSALWFSEYAQLGDPYEASIPQAVADRRVGWSPKELEIDRWGREQMRANSFASCWYSGDHESNAMWNVYGGANSAVAITTTRDKLRSAIPFFSYLAPVQYIDFATEEFDDVQPANRLVHKRKEFESEREVRAIVIDFRCHMIPSAAAKLKEHPQFRAIDTAKQPGGLSWSVNLGTLVDKVIIGPNASGWFQEVVEDLMRSAGLSCPVARSKMQGSARF